MVNGGSLRVAARIRSVSNGRLNISGGEITLPIVANSSASNATFFMQASGQLNMTGGTIVLERANASTGGDFLIANSTNKSISGGTLQIGNASTPANQTILINLAITINHLVVNGRTATAKLSANLAANGDGIVNSSATLDLGVNSMSVGGAVTNTGTLRQTKPVNNNTFEFLHVTNASNTADKYFGVDIITASNLGDTTVAVSGDRTCLNTNGLPVKRCLPSTKRWRAATR